MDSIYSSNDYRLIIDHPMQVQLLHLFPRLILIDRLIIDNQFSLISHTNLTKLKLIALRL